MKTHSHHSRLTTVVLVLATVLGLALPATSRAQDVPGAPPLPPSLAGGEGLPEPTLPCFVPALKGLTLTAAAKRLRQGGCTVGKVTVKRGSSRKGIVVAQSARAGTAYAGGSPIALVVGGRK